MTGLPNRRRTVELAVAALDHASDTQARRSPLPLIDMDHFKIINDRCGHATGDYVLKEFARAGREALREYGHPRTLGRRGVSAADAGDDGRSRRVEPRAVAHARVRDSLPSVGSELAGELSAGLATDETGARSLDELIARADAALYIAKNEGRDLVRVADENYLTSSTGTRLKLRIGL